MPLSKLKIYQSVKKYLSESNLETKLGQDPDKMQALVNELIEKHPNVAERELDDRVRDLLVQKMQELGIEETPSSPPRVLSLNQTIQTNRSTQHSKRTRATVDGTEDSNSGSVEKKRKPAGASQSANSATTTSSTPTTTRKFAMSSTKATSSSSSISASNKASNNSSTVSPFLTDCPTIRFQDIAGVDNILHQIQELILYPLSYLSLYTHLGVSSPCGILFHGPSGCGKSLLANAIAGETKLTYFKVSGPELIGGTSGESEENIRKVFEAARQSAPSILFIDAFEVLAAKKDSSQRGMDRRILAQLYDSIDQLIQLNSVPIPAPVVAPAFTNNATTSIIESVAAAPAATAPAGTAMPTTDSNSKHGSDSNGGKEGPPKQVFLIVATNKPDQLDSGVRGRFAREIALPVPDVHARVSILKLQTMYMTIHPQVDYQLLGKMTPGFVGSDLQVLARQAGLIAVSRIIKECNSKNSNSSSNLKAEEDTAIVQAVEGSGAAMEVEQTDATTTIPAAPASAQAADMAGTGNGNGAGTEAATTVVAPSIDLSASLALLLKTNNNNNNNHHHEDCFITMEDFLLAIKTIQPTAKREGFAIAPDVTWQDVGALVEVREELKHNLLEPIAHPERFRALGLEVPAGILFYGPPGCGKTLLAKALANQSGANFISVKGPELLNMYVGESESRVRQVFARARASAPCVIFFDELDALVPKRSNGFDGGSKGGGGGGGGNGVSERVVNQFLTELDGLEVRKDVYIIAATNRLELIDEAMLRPGRLGNLLYVPLPTSQDRIAILTALTRKVTVHYKKEDEEKDGGDGVDLASIALDTRCDGFSGADLSALVREAGLAVIKEISLGYDQMNSNTAASGDTTNQEEASKHLMASPKICRRHFELALQKVKPSVTPRDRHRFEKVCQNLKQGMSAVEALQMSYMDNTVSSVLLSLENSGQSK